ncbi:hypothetical protein [Desulfobotulus mexicanus]|nr:hypothetical protein [Desulfobotulus mexicanus]
MEKVHKVDGNAEQLSKNSIMVREGSENLAGLASDLKSLVGKFKI